jgi:hypothetical protein
VRPAASIDRAASAESKPSSSAAKSAAQRTAWEGTMTNRIVAGIRANLVAWLALFVALGGTSLAANHYLINSTKQISPKVLKKLRGSRGPRGAQGTAGARGATGATGATGPAGTPNTASFYTKTESDGRYLGAGAQAADSAKLGGTAASEFTFGAGAQAGRWQELVDKGKEPSFLAIPGIGELGVECTTSPQATAVSLTKDAETVFVMWNSMPAGKVSEMESVELTGTNTLLAKAFGPTEHGTGQMIIQASTVAADPSNVYADITVSASVVEGVCRFQANYTVASRKF